MKILGKIFTAILYHFVLLSVLVFTIKSILKHLRFFREYHPNMDEDTRHDRIVENVIGDLQKLKRNLGIPDRPAT